MQADSDMMAINNAVSLARLDEGREKPHLALDDGKTIFPVGSDIIPPNDHNSKIKPRNALPGTPSKSQLVVLINSSPQRPQSHAAAFDEQVHLDADAIVPATAAYPTKTGTPRPISNVQQSRMGPDAEPPRKRGRPKGWKPGMSYAELRGDPHPRDWRKPAPKKSVRSGSSTPVAASDTKRRGRPPKGLNVPLREYYLRSKPEYIPFACEWQDNTAAVCCPAELQNLETLRRHVFLVHGKTHPLICCWARCPQLSRVFSNEEAFRNHLIKAHLDRYAWYMGDGIQNRNPLGLHSGPNQLPRYLFDKDGNLVTPSIMSQEFEHSAGMAERRRQLREIRRRADENAPTEEEYALQTLGANILGPSI
ncbi:hypothetical protein BX600DRAFT_430693 [Xylariales sp. PMI_506]|nr:hypothetical protein BX600DRAFT_430693 [Xylariales sp. PMI_506]